ncbi:protein of unknown function DUF574 [Pseudofrankia inefficax]|uniref:S-adenosyl methyltransferase n=2 Tax=Pseudofrankia inefficax (strain DSM 45817 / CECT 9037 / DDB 130130 / EuI1c) TaxID=298654 RepID=E3IYE0_PSEI1|nr:protein of unknown function DUF574 [Pseudofrankia inefficax]
MLATRRVLLPDLRFAPTNQNNGAGRGRVAETAGVLSFMSQGEATGGNGPGRGIAELDEASCRVEDAFDRAEVARFERLEPIVRRAAAEHRDLHSRGVRFLARQGVRQFIDLSYGLATPRSTHRLARAVDPDSRVVYVDVDPTVRAAGTAPETRHTTLMTADPRDPAAVLASPQVRAFIDLDEPVGLLMLGVVHHLGDEDDPAAVVAGYKDALAAGSYLLLSHYLDRGAATAELEETLLAHRGTGRFRSRAEISAYFGGLATVPPGLSYAAMWRRETMFSGRVDAAVRLVLGGIGRKA